MSCLCVALFIALEEICMTVIRWRRAIAAFVLSLSLFVVACSPAEPPSVYDEIQEEVSQADTPAVSQEAIAGGEFNRFFPASVDDYQVVPSQEKSGFAEYKLNQGGTTIAMLSVNDTISNPDATTKFADSTREIGGYPAVDIGATQTAILVAGRFQVKVQSRDDSFTVENREAWLQQFDLAGIAQLLP